MKLFSLAATAVFVATTATADTAVLAVPKECAAAHISQTVDENGDVAYKMTHGGCGVDGDDVSVEYLVDHEKPTSAKDSAFVVLTRDAHDAAKKTSAAHEKEARDLDIAHGKALDKARSEHSDRMDEGERELEKKVGAEKEAHEKAAVSAKTEFDAAFDAAKSAHSKALAATKAEMKKLESDHADVLGKAREAHDERLAALKVKYEEKYKLAKEKVEAAKTAREAAAAKLKEVHDAARAAATKAHDETIAKLVAEDEAARKAAEKKAAEDAAMIEKMASKGPSFKYETKKFTTTSIGDGCQANAVNDQIEYVQITGADGDTLKVTVGYKPLHSGGWTMSTGVSVQCWHYTAGDRKWDSTPLLDKQDGPLGYSYGYNNGPSRTHNFTFKPQRIEQKDHYVRCGIIDRSSSSCKFDAGNHCASRTAGAGSGHHYDNADAKFNVA